MTRRGQDGVTELVMAEEMDNTLKVTRFPAAPGELRSPNCFLIGGIRCATTWLYATLAELPEVAVSLVEKETHFFNTHFDLGLEWYRNQFPHDSRARWVLDATPSYLGSPEVPSRIQEYCPDARLIAILRSPVERAYSDYCRRLNHGELTPSIADELTIDSPMVQHGLYYEHLQRYLEHFPREQILVLLYDDLLADPVSFFNQVREFLGISSTLPESKLRGRVNETKPLKRWPFVHQVLRSGYHTMLHWPLLGPMALRLRRGNYLWAYHRLNQDRFADYPPLPEPLRLQLEDYYRDDLQALSVWLGRDLSPWMAPVAAEA